MIMYADVYKTGYEKRISADGKVYENLNTCSAVEGDSSNFVFNVPADCEFEGCKSAESIPRFSHLSLTVNYLTTSKGNFFLVKKVSLIKDKG